MATHSGVHTHSPRWRSSTNTDVAERFRAAAELLEQQGASPFRVRSYRRAADALEALDEDVDAIVDREGMKGLLAIPTIGRSIAGVILEILQTGEWGMLKRLSGEQDPQGLFQCVPGIGPGLARRIREQLGIETLEELEIAAHDGTLEKVPGLGPRRVAGIRAILEGMFRQRRRRNMGPKGPPVEVLLDVDAEYRDKAEGGELFKIAPRRFNPEGEAWLPVLQTRRGEWKFRALFSNTEQAHRLEKTHDWVVIFYTGPDERGQYTVVTEGQGPQAGRRVVRGRETESRGYHARRARMH